MLARAFESKACSFRFLTWHERIKRSVTVRHAKADDLRIFTLHSSVCLATLPSASADRSNRSAASISTSESSVRAFPPDYRHSPGGNSPPSSRKRVHWSKRLQKNLAVLENQFHAHPSHQCQRTGLRDASIAPLVQVSENSLQ